MTAAARKAAAVDPARKQGYKVIGDAELIRITEGRVGQLEAELAGHLNLLAEQEADPHASDKDRENTQQIIESIEARLSALHSRLDALKANVAGDDAGAS